MLFFCHKKRPNWTGVKSTKLAVQPLHKKIHVRNKPKYFVPIEYTKVTLNNVLTTCPWRKRGNKKCYIIFPFSYLFYSQQGWTHWFVWNIILD
jgi:hypothetical protein